MIEKPVSTLDFDQLRCAEPRLFGPTLADRIRRAVIVFGVLGSLAWALWRIDATPDRLVDGISRLGFLIGFMWPPTAAGNVDLFAWALVETLAIAFLGTLLGALMAFPVSFLAARNVVRRSSLRFPVRRGLDVIRGIDVLIFAMIFIAVIGLGPFAGILAIAVNDIGNFAKLFSEAIENTDDRPVEGAAATGCNRVEQIRFGLLPQVLPVMLSHVLYLFESNVRAASVIGIVGAGGIGFLLSERIRGNYWDQVAFIILAMLVMVFAIDRLSHAVRRRIIGIGTRRA